MPAFSPSKSKSFIEKELGGPIHMLFREFEDLPIAAASLGQVFTLCFSFFFFLKSSTSIIVQTFLINKLNHLSTYMCTDVSIKQGSKSSPFFTCAMLIVILESC